MKNVLRTALFTVAAVPFLMAAPSTAKKAQNTAAPATQNKVAAKKAHKKTTKKSVKAAPSSTAKK